MMDVHFRLLRQDFVEPLREAIIGYRKDQLEQREVSVGTSTCVRHREGGSREVSICKHKSVFRR